MHIIARPKIEAYSNRYPNAREALLSWYDQVKKAQYTRPEDVQAYWGVDSVLPDSWGVFNIKGNQYRLVVRFNYPAQAVYIRWFGTHAEYNRIDVFKV